MTKSCRYDLNKIPYDYTKEVMNRFKELYLVDRVPKGLWMKVHNITGGSNQNHPKEKEIQEGKVIV